MKYFFIYFNYIMQSSKINILDSRLVSKEPVVPLIRGASNISKLTVAPVGGTASLNNIQYNVQITAPNTCLDRGFYHQVKCTLRLPFTNKSTTTITSDGLNVANFINANNLTYGDYPLSSIFDSVSLSVNEKQICSYSATELRNILIRMNNVKKNIESIPCPSCVETGYANVADAWLTSSNSNATYADSKTGFVPNGAFSYTLGAVYTTVSGTVGYIAPNGTGFVDVVVSTIEPLIMPFFSHLNDSEEEQGMYYVRNVVLNMTIASTINRVFRYNGASLNTGAATASTLAQITGNPVLMSIDSSTKLHYKILSSPLYDGFRLPTPVATLKTFTVSSSSVSGEGWSAQAIDATAQASLTQMKTSGSLPRYVILAGRKQFTSYDVGEANWFYPITKVSINSENGQNLMSSFGDYDLYQMNRQNGISSSWIEAYGSANTIDYSSSGAVAGAVSAPLCSCPLILEFGKDIPLPVGVVPGSAGSFSYDFTVSFRSQFANPQPLVLTVCYVYDAYLTINSSTLEADFVKSNLTFDEVVGSSVSAPSDEVQQESGAGLMNRMNNLNVAQRSNINGGRLTGGGIVAGGALRRVKH